MPKMPKTSNFSMPIAMLTSEEINPRTIARNKLLSMKLSFRMEGHWYNCYLADQNTDEGRLFLGTIAAHAVKSSPELQKQFRDLMQKTLGNIVKDVFGTDVSHWDKQTYYIHPKERK